MDDWNSDPLPSREFIFPKWRVAREANLSDLCIALVARAENLSLATQRYAHQNI
jgi:hypothetical protein